MRQFKVIESCDRRELENELAEYDRNGWEVVGFSHAVDPGSKLPLTFAVLLVSWESKPVMKSVEAAAMYRVEPFVDEVIPEARFNLVTDVRPVARLVPFAVASGIIGV